MIRDAVTRAVLPDVGRLLDAASSRVPFKPADGLSDVPMERVVVDGKRYVAKWIGPRVDWVARATGDVGPEPRVVQLWRTGLLDSIPELDTTIHAIARDGDLHVLLMRDVSEHFLPEGHIEIPLEQHRRFLDHLAALHAATWGFADPGLRFATLHERYHAITPSVVARDRAAGWAIDGVRAIIEPAWDALLAQLPVEGPQLLALAEEPERLVAAMGELPQTLVHGDCKAGNLGSHPDGRTILVDWSWPGPAPCTADLAWYLAINCTRLPESKEAAIAAYRDALERRGVDTSPWWERALELALLGGAVHFAWSKLSEPEELDWWLEHARPCLDELT